MVRGWCGVAWTEDDGQTWTKLNYGQGGNPVIYSWPEKNLSECVRASWFVSAFVSARGIRSTMKGGADIDPITSSTSLLAGFRDPYVFRSQYLSKLLIQNDNVNTTTTNTNTTSPTGTTAFANQWFSTLSGGQVDVGPHLWLYKQREEGDFANWDWAGRFFEIDGLRESWSDWSGSESG